MPPITHLLVLLYNLGHCWVIIFHARSLAFWELPGFIKFWTLWIFQCRDHDLLRRWLRCRCIVRSIGFYIWKSTASRCWYSSGCIKASMSRCLSCPFSLSFSSFALDCSFCSLFSFFYVVCSYSRLSLLHTTPSLNSCTNWNNDYTMITLQFHTLYKFVWFIRGCQPLGWISDTLYL